MVFAPEPWYTYLVTINTSHNGNAGDCMCMTDSQFKGFVRFVLDDIKEVLENMPDSKEKEKLQKVADNLQ